MPDNVWFWCIAAFLCGSIPWGILAGRMRGIDLREHGSKNIGATNTLRVLGKGPGIVVLILDTLKGWLPVFLAERAGLTGDPVVGVALLAVLGHIYSPWVRFRGGKGVATTLGILFGLDPRIAAAILVVFLIAFLIAGRRVSVGSMVASVVQAGLFWLVPGHTLSEQILTTVVALFIVVRHRDNIQRLMRGEEKGLDLKG
ncbi:MAG: glycerol-3-phosphate 1-O-acyltransferase PlsY [Armatimonadaceae bacterium]|jgi:glycerol-3-phosphate acyltransferase PlsY